MLRLPSASMSIFQAGAGFFAFTSVIDAISGASGSPTSTRASSRPEVRTACCTLATRTGACGGQSAASRARWCRRPRPRRSAFVYIARSTTICAPACAAEALDRPRRSAGRRRSGTRRRRRRWCGCSAASVNVCCDRARAVLEQQRHARGARRTATCSRSGCRSAVAARAARLRLRRAPTRAGRRRAGASCAPSVHSAGAVRRPPHRALDDDRHAVGRARRSSTSAAAGRAAGILARRRQMCQAAVGGDACRAWSRSCRPGSR